MPTLALKLLNLLYLECVDLNVSIFTCSNASVGEVWRDGYFSAFVDAHAQNATIHPGDQSPQSHLTDEGLSSVMAAMGTNEKAVVSWLNKI